MGLFAKLRGTERTPDAEAAVERLHGALPDGWRLVELRQQMFCRQPVKLYVWAASARRQALDLLPASSRPMNVDAEPSGSVPVFAVVAQTPDRLGIAGVGLSRAEAWRALAERLRGELAQADVWVPAAG